MDVEQKAATLALFTQLAEKYDEIEFHHGDCIGSDAQAAIAMDAVRRHLIDYFGSRAGCTIRIICHPGYPPNHPKETKFRAFTNFNDEIREPKPFVARDHDIVDETEEMIATPVSANEEIRSGTWTTVRYARKRKRKITILLPKKTKKFDPHALPAKTNAVLGETNLYGPTHRQRGVR